MAYSGEGIQDQVETLYENFPVFIRKLMSKRTNCDTKSTEFSVLKSHKEAIQVLKSSLLGIVLKIFTGNFVQNKTEYERIN